MWLSALAIKRPILMTMFIGALVVLGLYSYSRMPIELFPNIDIPAATIVTVYPGAGPEEIETLVSKPLEEAVSTVSNIDTVSSYSREGVSVVVTQFKTGTDIEVAVADVRARVDAAKGRLPLDAETPVISKFEMGALPVLWLGVSGKRPLTELFRLCDTTIKDRLSTVDGVASVNVGGASKREIQVRLDPDKLAAHAIALQDVQDAIARQNLNLPAGNIYEGSRQYSVRSLGEFTAVRNISDIYVPLRDMNGMEVGNVKVGQLGRVLDTQADVSELSRLNQRESVAITVQKRSGANTIAVVDGIRRQVASLKKELPKDIDIREAQDQSTFIRESVHDVRTHLLLGALLATLVVYLFLRTVRATFIIGLAIPTSIMAAFIPIYFAGFTQNMMVLLALALSVGILVDDSIVVLENIFRHLSLGEEPKEAAYNGRSEIGFAAVAITLTDVVVFVPIAFTAGIVGQIFRQFGLTIATVTLFSLFASFTLAPMLASRWLKTSDAVRHRSDGTPAGEGLSYRTYRRMLRWALHHRWQVVTVGFGSLILFGAVLGVRVQTQFFPQTDQGQFAVQIKLPVGSRLEATNLVVNQIEKRLTTIPEVENVFTTVGSSGSGIMSAGEAGPHTAEVQVKLKEKTATIGRILHVLGLPVKGRTRSDAQLRAFTENMLRDIPGVEILVVPVGGIGGGHGAPIELQVTGQDLNVLEKYAHGLLQEMKQMPALREADWTYYLGRPELQVALNRERAADLSFSTAQVASALRSAIQGAVATEYREGGEEYDVRVRLDLPQGLQQQDLESLYLTSKQSTPVRVSDLASVRLSSGPTEIRRKDKQRLIVLSSYLAAGTSLGQAQKELQAKLAASPPPSGIKVGFGGESEMMQESFANLFVSLLLSIVLVYMLMAGLFESVWHPLTIMLALPMALVGAFGALLASGINFDIVTFIGLIMLVGLVTKNSILLVDYTNTLRSRGLGREEAVSEAGPVRLRPIAMTTFTIICAMSPIALGLGSGAEIRRPMAIVVIGGVALSTLLTLIIIPVMYTIMDDLQGSIGKVKNWFARKVGLGGQ
jgi:HAE1 family hydrophobic/amphiphilic exporter-1